MPLLDPSFLASLSPALPQRLPQVQLLVLFGARAMGTATDRSDWDLAVLAQTASPWEVFLMQKDLADLLHLPFDTLDVVNLGRCSPLLAYAVARQGQLLYESEPGKFR